MGGVVPKGYECYGPDGGRASWPKTSSPELLALGWKPRSLDEWAASPHVKAALSR